MSDKKLSPNTQTDNAAKPLKHQQPNHHAPIILQALLEGVAALNQSYTLEQTFDHILVSIARVVSYELAIILRVNDNKGDIISFKSEINPQVLADIEPIPIDGIDLLEVIRTSRRPYIIDDTQTNSIWIEVPEHKALRSAICIPLFLNDKFWGGIALLTSPPKFYSIQTSEQLEGFVELLLLAIKKALCDQQSRDLDTIQERNRVARNLNDAVSQTLFSANTMAESLKLLGGTAEKAPTYIAQLANMTREAVLETRLLFFELHPEILLKTELSLLIKYLCDAFRLRTHIPLSLTTSTFTTSESLLLPDAVHLTFYRAAQEIFNIIQTYLSATQVAVSLHTQMDVVELRIYDDGKDSPAPSVDTLHSKLLPLTERLCSIGLSLNLDSHLENGFVLVLQYQKLTNQLV